MAISEQKCEIHPRRGAAARCPVCESVFCRECITEHEGRVVCARCLSSMTEDATDEGERTLLYSGVLRVACGLLIGWLFFYTVARVLLRITEPLDVPY